MEAELNRNLDLVDADLRSLAVLAMYRPLHTVGGADRLAARRPRPAVLEKLLQRSVLDVLAERALRQDITVIGPIVDNVSNAVRGMYEEHPYPRWFAFVRAPPLEFAEWLARQVLVRAGPGGISRRAAYPVRRVRDRHGSNLAGQRHRGRAGAGSGLEPVEPGFCPAPGARTQCNEHRIPTGQYSGAGRAGRALRPDFLFGRPHHMLDPAAGLRVLLKLLHADGLLKIGLYSEKARANVNAAREIIREQRLPTTAAAIREFRQQVFASPTDSPVRPLLKFRDFYGMSTCRDLLFHVQEHQFSLPKIESLLHEHGLEILGLSDVSTDAINAYRQMFSASDGMKNLKDWDAFEAAHPETFVAMYQSRCRLPRRMAP